MRLNLSAPVLIGVMALIVTIAACGASSSPSEENPQSEAASEVSAICGPQYVTPAEAGQHMGEEVTVCGFIEDYHFRHAGDDPTILMFKNLGTATYTREAKLSFAIFILRKKTDFSANLGSIYTNKTVCITGVVETLPDGFGRFSEDTPVISATSSSQIDVDCKAQPANS